MKKAILFLFWFGVISADAADYTILDFGAKLDTTPSSIYVLGMIAKAIVISSFIV